MQGEGEGEGECGRVGESGIYLYTVSVFIYTLRNAIDLLVVVDGKTSAKNSTGITCAVHCIDSIESILHFIRCSIDYLLAVERRTRIALVHSTDSTPQPEHSPSTATATATVYVLAPLPAPLLAPPLLHYSSASYIGAPLALHWHSIGTTLELHWKSHRHICQ